MVVELREVADAVIKILSTLLMAEVNVHFSYPLLTRPMVALPSPCMSNDSECASSVLARRFPVALTKRYFAIV